MFGPGLVPGRFWRPLATGASATPVVSVAGFGPAGAATFVLSLEPGTKVTYGWATEVIASYSGREQRISYQAQPSIRIEGRAFLVDNGDGVFGADSRTIRAELMKAAATGATFLVGLPHEERIIDSIADDGVTVSVGDTNNCDWAQVGQRVVIVCAVSQDPDPPALVSGAAIIQRTTASQIVLDAIPAGVIVSAAASIMPAIPVVLDPQQGWTRHPVTVDYWDLRAKAVAYGWCGLDIMGAGAEVLTFDAGLVAASALTDDNLIIWDRPNLIDGTADETLATKTDLIDLGGLIFSVGGSTIPDWIRPIKLRSTSIDDQQWLKAVTRHCRGAQGMFLLPTGRPDLASGGSPAFGKLDVFGDYAAWFTSSAHRRLAITNMAGITQYVTVLSVVDNGGGASTLSLSDGLIGVPETISFLEQVRLETDDVPVVWDGAMFTCDLVAHVVQDATTAEEIVTSAFSGTGADLDITFPVGIYSMTRDMYWETGQLQAGSIIETNGFVPHFRTALIGPPTGLAIIRRNGADASGATGGAGYVAGSGTLGGGSGTGQTGGTGAGSAAAAFGFWPTTGHPGIGGAGGAGTNAGGAAGGAPTSLQPDSAGSLDVFAAIRMRFMTGSTTPISGGAGGSSGGGSGSATGGGGGGGAGDVVVCAGQFLNESRILVQAKGGAGGAGAGANCGGGGGGGGGLIAMVAGRLPFPTTDNAGGGGGSSGGGTGVAGSAGNPGATPMLFVG